MKVSELFKYVIERGIEKDPRGKQGIERYLADVNKEYEKLDDGEKELFDSERLWNPYDDSRILNNPNDPEVGRVLMGINIDGAEILLADRLREKGEKIDLVIGHHPRGKARPGLYKVMDIQKDLYAHWGVPINVSEQLMEPRIEEVKRAMMPACHNQPVDTARLLGIPFMNTHCPADILVQDFIQKELDAREHYSVGDVIAHLKEYPEYRHAARTNNPPRAIVGKSRNRAGKVVVKFSGGTGGAKTLYEAFEKAGVGTFVCMHLAEDHIELAKEHHVNVVVASHMASDSMGMNLMYADLEREGKLEIVRFSGLYAPKD